MEGKKPAAYGSSSSSSSSSIADELFGRKDTGIFSCVFPGLTSDGVRALFQPDLFCGSRKQGSGGRSWTSQSNSADGNCQGSPSKGLNIVNKDKYSGGAVNTCNLSSSLYYGGQDICSNIPSSQNYGIQYTNKKDSGDDPDDPNMASRGDWWQGSLYY